MGIPTPIVITLDVIMILLSLVMFFGHIKFELSKCVPRKVYIMHLVSDGASALGFTAAIVATLNRDNDPLGAISSLAVIILLGISLVLSGILFFHYRCHGGGLKARLQARINESMAKDAETLRDGIEKLRSEGKNTDYAEKMLKKLEDDLEKHAGESKEATPEKPADEAN